MPKELSYEALHKGDHKELSFEAERLSVDVVHVNEEIYHYLLAFGHQKHEV
jgi:hypothetical protein